VAGNSSDDGRFASPLLYSRFAPNAIHPKFYDDRNVSMLFEADQLLIRARCGDRGFNNAVDAASVGVAVTQFVCNVDAIATRSCATRDQ